MTKYFVISDLHLNMGKRPDGTLHPLEDFDSDDEFGTLLETVLENKGQLVINPSEPFSFDPRMRKTRGSVRAV